MVMGNMIKKKIHALLDEIHFFISSKTFDLNVNWIYIGIDKSSCCS